MTLQTVQAPNFDFNKSMGENFTSLGDTEGDEVAFILVVYHNLVPVYDGETGYVKVYQHQNCGQRKPDDAPAFPREGVTLQEPTAIAVISWEGPGCKACTMGGKYWPCCPVG
jgi:hypothetical protein